MALCDALATERHYVDHLAPIWRALEPQERGTFYVDPRLENHARALGLDVTLRAQLGPGELTLVAGYMDACRARRRPIVLLEHGAGQHYQGLSNGSYSGGAGRQSVRLFLCPNDEVAARNAEVYPRARTAVVGAPKLDPWFAGEGRWPLAGDPVVAISFHWDCQLVAEARSAFGHYARALAELAAAFTVIGHGHPRIFDGIARHYREAGIEPVREFGEVLERASCYVVDNSSTGVEFMAARGPVVWMNAPWYRRDVEHGARFWDWTRGIPTVDEPEQLQDAIRRALAGEGAPRAREIVEQVYAVRDGTSAARAAEAIREVA